MKGYCEDLDLLAKVLSVKDHEIVWSTRTPDVFAAMPEFYRYAIYERGAEDFAEEVCEEAALRFNDGTLVGTRPQWHRVNKRAKDTNRYYIKFDDKMVLDAAIADALDLDVDYVRMIAMRDYKQAEATKKRSLTAPYKKKKRRAEKYKEWKEQQEQRHAEAQARKAALKARALEIAEEVQRDFCGKTMQPGEVRRVKSYARKSALSILTVGQIDEAAIPEIIIKSLKDVNYE